jgi:hypothetical protein
MASIQLRASGSPLWLVALVALVATWPTDADALTGVLYGARETGNNIAVASTDLAQPQAPVRRILSVPKTVEGERLGGFVQQLDGTLALYTIRPATDPRPQSTRLIVLQRPNALAPSAPRVERLISGLGRRTAISSLVPFDTTRMVALVSHLTDTPPYRFAVLNVADSQIRLASGFPLPSGVRHANLTHCPDGTFYSTATAPQIGTTLVRVDFRGRRLQRVARLSLQGNSLGNDLAALACGPDGILYGLADPTYLGTKSLYEIDARNGNLRFVREFDADRASFSNPLRSQAIDF